MPEMNFRVRWPDGTQSECYSPSLVIRDHLRVGGSYDVADFLQKSGAALNEASARVHARYGFACSRALGQLQIIEQACAPFLHQSDARVQVLSFTSPEGIPL